VVLWLSTVLCDSGVHQQLLCLSRALHLALGLAHLSRQLSPRRLFHHGNRSVVYDGKNKHSFPLKLKQSDNDDDTHVDDGDL
jgi:hypothetical protein